MASNNHLAHVFSPVEIGGLALRNRIFVPAHTTNFADNNLPSERHLEYHRAKAAGGAALIIFETIRVHPTSIGRSGATAGYDDACIEPFRKITDAVHTEGARIFGQIVHMGREVDGTYARSATWGPSEVPWSPVATIPHMMTRADIALVVRNHAEAARRLVAAGFDGVEVHLGHGHLLQQFLSPSSNRRSDQYGGALETRLRFAFEVLEAVRKEVGPTFPMGIRISAEEFLPDGLSLADMGPITRKIVDRVKVDFVNVSHSAYHASYSLSTQMADMQFSAEAFRSLPKGIAAHLKGAADRPPVFAVCKFVDLAEADAFLSEGDIAMIGMARAHIADPEIVRKTMEGRSQDIRPCIHCNQGCVGMLQAGLPITCLVNPTAGREGEWPLAPTKTSAAKRVLVVGGGPAGLEAASIAASQGHDVTLWEASQQLGGELNLLETMPQRRDFLKLLDHQKRQCRVQGVKIILERSGTAKSVQDFSPDTLVLATGASQQSMQFAGGGEGLSLGAALTRVDQLGKRIAVVDTLGSWAVASVVEHFCNLAHDVTLFVPGGQIAWNVPIYSSFAWRSRVREKGLKVIAMKEIYSAHAGKVTLRDVWSGEFEDGGVFDAVIAPAPSSSRTALYDQIEEAAAISMENIVVVGDAISPRSALEAVFEGHRAGRELRRA